MSILGTIGGLISNVAAPVAGALGGGPIASKIIGLAGNAIGGAMQSSDSNSESLQSQKELAQYNNDLDRQTWIERFNMENQYSSPTAQKKRLIDAGLNPNLAYGSLSGNVVQNPHTNQPSGHLSNYYTANEMEIQNMQKQMMRAEIELKEAEANKLNYDSGLIDEETRGKKLLNDAFDAAVNEVGFNPFREEVYNNENLRQFRAWMYELDKEYRDKEFSLASDKFEHSKNVDLESLKQNLYHLVTERRLSFAQAAHYYAGAELARAQGLVSSATADSIKLDIQGKEIDLKYSELNHIFDLAYKSINNKLTYQKFKESIAKTLNINVQSADIIARRMQSIVRQSATLGLTY